MPCRDPGPPMETTPSRSQKRAKFFEAAMCGVFTFLEGNEVPILEDVLENLDYEEMGVTRQEIETWWIKHKRKDEERRQREEAARRKQELRDNALSKLSDDEREALGL